MNTINLNEIERKAFRSTYQDGLWDVYYGLMLMSMAVFMFRPVGGYRPTNILLALVCFSVSYLLFWLGKKYITLPRMGQVQFGEARRKRARTLIVIMSVFVLLQVVLLLFTAFGWLNAQVRQQVNTILKDRDIMDLAVATPASSDGGAKGAPAARDIEPVATLPAMNTTNRARS
jgi:hypothetical protein